MKKRLKIILAHFISLAVFITTMLVANHIAKVRLMDKAFDAAALENDVIKKSTNIVIMSYEWMFNSFLSGFCTIEPYTEGSSDEYLCIIPQEELVKMDKEYINQHMKSFLAYSLGFYSISFIINPGIIPSAPNGYAPQLTSGRNEITDLLGTSDIFGSDFYYRVSEARRSISFEYQTENKPFNVWSVGIPIHDENGRMIGECWAEVKADYISEIINLFQSQDDRAVSIISKNMTILASSNPSFNGKSIIEAAEEKDPDHIMDKWMNDVEQCILSDTDTTFRHNYYGIDCFTYIRGLANSPFTMVVVKSVREISKAVTKFSIQFYIMAFISLMLLTICLRYIFVAFRNENEHNRKIENELDIASGIQKRILPGNITTDEYEIYGFQKQAKSVGGDLYDYFVKDRKLHFCIGDVSGKGIPASLVMTELCSLYRFIASNGDDSEQIVKTLNDAVIEHSDDSMICTLFAGILDLTTGKLDYCNAGHTPPVLIKEDRSASFLNIKANMPIYAFGHYPYKSGTLQINQGEKIFLYTDGVTEARNRKQHFFGSDAMLAALKKNTGKNLETIVNGVLNQISSFSGKAEQNDDITIMCIEYKGLAI